MMDEQQAEAVADGEVTAPEPAKPSGRLRTLAIWGTLMVIGAALLGGGLFVWRGLQADKAITLVAQSARQDAAAGGAAVAAAAPTAVPAQLPVTAPAPVSSAAAAPAVAPTQAQAQAQPPQAVAALAVPPYAPPQISPVKAASKKAYKGKRLAVRSRALARTGPPGRAPKRLVSAASVEQRLDRCRDRAGEAAAACFARACATYARRSPVCLNDEPAQRP